MDNPLNGTKVTGHYYGNRFTGTVDVFDLRFGGFNRPLHSIVISVIFDAPTMIAIGNDPDNAEVRESVLMDVHHIPTLSSCWNHSAISTVA